MASLSRTEGKEKRPRALRSPGHRFRVQGGAGGPERRTRRKWHEAKEQRRDGTWGCQLRGVQGPGGARGGGHWSHRGPAGAGEDPTGGTPGQSAVRATQTGGSKDGRLVWFFFSFTYFLTFYERGIILYIPCFSFLFFPSSCVINSLPY